MQTLYKIESAPHQSPRLIFRVITDKNPVFLCTSHQSDAYSVVEVSTPLFIELWRNDPDENHWHVSRGDPESWRKDDKFHWAEDGFSEGESNPVPLADVHCEINDIKKDVWVRRNLFFKQYAGQQTVKRIPYVGFNNGITRSIWLMSHGAQVFPVMCRTDNAPLVQLLVGLRDGAPKTINEFLASSENV